MRQNILTAVIIVILLGIGFIWFRFLGTPSSGGPATPAIVPYSDDDDIRQFRLLKNLNLDQSLFSDAAFRGLVRFGGIGPASELPKGRANPFSPF